jgi:2-dehydro-3-deoxyphosphogluconate aldolase / (4S)-4-hydroxy-2-oxoglutarate aldolase
MRAVLERLQESGIVAIVRVPSPHGVRAACRAVCTGGICAVEITLTVPGALNVVADLVSEFGDDLVVGAGTVLDVEACRRSLDAGAQFVVSPAFDSGVVDHCRKHSVLPVPGALTPTEVASARQGGADLVKLFPARIATPNYMRDLLGPFPAMRLMPTGGIDEAGASAYLAAGAAVVGIGSRLMEPAAVAAGDVETIAAAADRFARVAASARGTR